MQHYKVDFAKPKGISNEPNKNHSVIRLALVPIGVKHNAQASRVLVRGKIKQDDNKLANFPTLKTPT